MTVKLSFNDFTLDEEVINNSSFRQYLCYDQPFECVLKYYGPFAQIKKSTWKLEIYVGDHKKGYIVTFEEQTADPMRVIDSFNKSRDLVYKIIDRIF